MKYQLTFCFLILITASLAVVVSAQGDIRSATGMPIPIGAPVIWGQIELKGLRSGEPRPTVFVTLMHNGVQLGRAQANDRGYYYFIQRARDGSVLLVTVGGTDIGSQMISSAGGDRYDMSVNWSENTPPAQQTGVISVKDAYTGRSAANGKLFDSASAAAKAKKIDEALKLFNKIVASDPKDFVAWTEIGSLYFGESEFTDAEKSYNKAIEIKPDFMLALLNLGKLYIARQKPQEAIAVLEKAIAADPKSAEANHYLGEAYLQNKQGSKAVAVLNEAIRLDPNGKADVHVRLAALYNAAGLKDRAANEYKLFLAKKPDHPEKSKLEKYIKDNLK